MVNLRPIYVRAGTASAFRQLLPAWQALCHAPVLQLDEP
jgi:hypothetical protein